MKSRLLVLFLSLCLLFLAGCTPQKASALSTYPLREAAESVRLLGRSYVVQNGITCDFTASGISFRVTASGKVYLHLFSDRTAYFTVFIDGIRCDTRFSVKEGINVLEIADFKQKESHHIRIVKQTEASLALCTLVALSFSGSFEPPPEEKPLYFEFLGDSITCGCGNLCTVGTSDPSDAVHEDGTAAFPFLTAERFDADCSVIGCSGIGVVNSFTGFTLQDFYHQQCYFRLDSQPYLPSKIPDLIIINAGTNDETLEANAEEFAEKAEALIASLRQLYAQKVPIIWTCNMMQDGMYSSIQKAVLALGGESESLYLCSLNRNNEGGGGHPSVAGHQDATSILYQFIVDKNILNAN